MFEKEGTIYAVYSVNQVTHKVTIYCAVSTEEGAHEALVRVRKHWLDPDEEFFSSPILFYS